MYSIVISCCDCCVYFICLLYVLGMASQNLWARSADYPARNNSLHAWWWLIRVGTLLAVSWLCELRPLILHQVAHLLNVSITLYYRSPTSHASTRLNLSECGSTKLWIIILYCGTLRFRTGLLLLLQPDRSKYHKSLDHCVRCGYDIVCHSSRPPAADIPHSARASFCALPCNSQPRPSSPPLLPLPPLHTLYVSWVCFQESIEVSI